MKNKFKIFITFLFVLIVCSPKVQSQLSKKHYIPPLTSAEFGNANPEDQYFYISTPSTKNVTYTITLVGQPSSSTISGIISNANPAEISLGTGYGQLFIESNQSSVVKNTKGYIIEAEDVIYVSLRMKAGGGAQAGALVSKGLSALGNTFRVGSFTNQNPQTNYMNFVSVMATEDNTAITFDDLPIGLTIKNYTGPFPVIINLNEGESYTIATNSSENTINRDGLIGTLVQSDKPIVVNCGSANGSFHNGTGRDYGIDQIVGYSKVGNEYIFVKGDGNNEWENVLLVAHEDNTTISINGNTPVATINAGEYYLIEGDNYSANQNMYVLTSKNVFAYQGIGANTSEANQGLFFVPPLSCENRGNVNTIASIQNIGTTTYNGGITIITNKNATVTVNSQPINALPQDVTGNTNYVTYKLSGLTGDVSIESSGELYCAYYNFNGAATSGSFYSGFPSAPEINLNTAVQSLGTCIPNITLSATNIDIFDQFEWFFDDGTGYVTTGTTSNSIVPTQPGKYKLIGTINCSGLQFESIEIPVSVCPDDADNDGVIDNKDIDNDNDGILNCDEGKGDASINLADISNPKIVFSDATTNTTIPSSTFTQTNINGTINTFIGQTSGNFTSTANAANTSNLEYTLNFTQPVNFKFTETTGTNHSNITGEYFILKIAPSNKNITLLDPDNQLLIDTNFDGIFESGILDFSASEIRFKYNPSSTGITPYQFIANQVNQVSFVHHLSNLIENSVFNGTLQLTCFDLDTDNDGIVNSFDSDSDNDGIPDLIEKNGTSITLSNTDTNIDGLDDIFDITIKAIDTDNDTVLNFLDIDSDNDGIFDLEESGHGLPDLDADGIIDNAIALIGTNGFVDALETNPDSNLIGYIITDTDNDSIFNYLELDSDNDTCSDVTEAGFTDLDEDGLLGNSPITIDTFGKVINVADGYSTPHINYVIYAPIVLNSSFEDVAFCETSTSLINIDSTADTFQWELSTDGTNWSTITDNAVYSGSATNTLQITNILLSYDAYKYRVNLNRTGNSCGFTSNETTLTVNPLPIITAAVELKQCDDDVDGFSIFNLNEANSKISANSANETFTFFPTLADANANTNVITNNTAFQTSVKPTETVWVRATSTFGCYRVSELDLIVSVTAIPSGFSRSFTQCDDFIDINGNNTVNNDDTDGVTSFDFSAVTQDVLTALNTTLNLATITYFRNEADALAELNAITDPSAYRNIGYPTTQQIYIRVDSKLDNACLGFGPYITLNVDPVPTSTTPPNLEFCDNFDDGNGINGIVQTFDLTSQDTTVLGGQNPANFTVTYHSSSANANSGSNPLASPYTNTARDIQTIYVRVENNATGCFNDHVSFNLVVNPLPIANFVNDLEICDDNSDGSARNGFSQSFDLESQTAGILGPQDPTNYSVTYHKSLINAQNNTSPLGSPFSNDIAFRQRIYVRIFNANTQCTNGISNFDVIVNPEPIAQTVSNLSYCDNGLDAEDDNGFVQNIDLDSQILTILGTTQIQADFDVTFHLSNTEATSGANALSSPFSNTIANQQTIYVRVKDKKTGCVNDDTSFDVIINPLPFFEVATPQIVCLNGPNLTIEVERTGAVYTYEWLAPDGTITTNDELTVSSGGLYTVTATTTNGTGCSRTRTIQVNESIIATITENDITVVDDSDNNSITIDNSTDNLGIGDYEFALADTDGNIIKNYQDEPLFEGLEGGVYNVLVRDKNGCGIASVIVPVVTYPKFFTPNNDGVLDTWKIPVSNNSFYTSARVEIFDRYGKVVALITDKNGQGWDGTYNGKKLPSNDYWFNAVLEDIKGTIRKKTGHFSLLRK